MSEIPILNPKRLSVKIPISVFGLYSNQNARFGRRYCKFSSPGNVCKTVEGSIATECGVKGCNRFC